MSSPLRRDYALIALLGIGALLTFGAQNAAKGRTFTVPPAAALPLTYHDWKGTLLPEDPGTQAILPHARITMAQYEQPGVPPVVTAIVGSRDPNDMHTPERCFVGSGFEIVNVERREVKIDKPEPKTWLFNLMTVKGNGGQELVLYGYDGVQMLGSSTIMARVMMKLRGPSKEPAYFVRLSTPLDDPQAAEQRLMTFAQNLMSDRASWQKQAASVAQTAGVKP